MSPLIFEQVRQCFAYAPSESPTAADLADVLRSAVDTHAGPSEKSAALSAALERMTTENDALRRELEAVRTLKS